MPAKQRRTRVVRLEAVMAAISIRSNPSAWSLLLPALAVLTLSAALAFQTGVVRWPDALPLVAGPETVTIPVHHFRYRADGEFYRNGYAVDAPMVEASIDAPLTISKYQISVGEYDLCVADGACQPAERTATAATDVPVTGVSYHDAMAYAKWLSARSGAVWTVPSHEQIAYAAGGRFPDDALGIDPESRNPALRWLADYDREAARKASPNPAPQPRGSFGGNEFGLADFAGNVWEWTTTCQRRVALDGDGVQAAPVQTCGIYVTVGRHRAPMSDFVREPKGGGCSVGTPPDNLGFRVIRDGRWYAAIRQALRNLRLDP
jgi:formylglycine-generating enzyme required for sulfatase activity